MANDIGLAEQMFREGADRQAPKSSSTSQPINGLGCDVSEDRGRVRGHIDVEGEIPDVEHVPLGGALVRDAGAAGDLARPAELAASRVLVEVLKERAHVSGARHQRVDLLDRCVERWILPQGSNRGGHSNHVSSRHGEQGGVRLPLDHLGQVIFDPVAFGLDRAPPLSQRSRESERKLLR